MSDEVAPEHTALSEAINQASEETLRLILHDLVETCQVTRERLAMFLLVDEFEVRTFARDPPPFGPASSQLDSSRGESSDSERRKQVPRFALCAACEQEYDVTENTIRSCWYHPQDYEANAAFFIDNGILEFGITSDAELCEKYPEGFYYPCCSRGVTAEPCCIDWHREVDSSE